MAAPSAPSIVKVFTVPCWSDSAGQRNLGYLIEVDAPSLIRVEAVKANGTYIYGGPSVSTRAFTIELLANPIQDNTSVPQQTGVMETPSNILRGAGPHIYLPSPGAYFVRGRLLNSAGFGGATMSLECSAQVNFPPEMLYLAMNTGPGNTVFEEILAVPAGGSIGFPSAVNAITRGFVRAHACTEFSLVNGAGAIVLGIGEIATAAFGRPIAASGVLTKTWPEIAGATISFFSTAGSNVYIRGKFY